MTTVNQEDTQQIKIALIDDNDFLREMMHFTLDFLGFNILFEASNGKSALQKISESDTMPDVCLIDIQMPVMNGFDTVKTIRTQYPMLKVLVFSSNDNKKDIVRIIDLDAHGYIIKGADPTCLRSGIHSVYNGRRFFCPQVRRIAGDRIADL